MSYSMNISGHGATGEKVKEVFATAIKALAEDHAANASGEPGGYASGSSVSGESFSITSTEVLHPAAAEDEETES